MNAVIARLCIGASLGALALAIVADVPDALAAAGGALLPTGVAILTLERLGS